MFLTSLPLHRMIKVIFAMYIFSQIFKKRELRENMHNGKMSTFTVVHVGARGLSNHLAGF